MQKDSCTTLYDEDITNFINYGWDEAVQAGLKYKDEDIRELLWQAMKEKYPNQCTGDLHPLMTTSIALACSGVPTQPQRYEEWVEKYAKNFSKKVAAFIIALKSSLEIVLPSVLVSIISEYAESQPTLLDADEDTSS